MILSTLLKALKPFHLASLLTTYFLGAGLVQYVRGMRSWSSFFEGLLFLVLIVTSLELLILLRELTNRAHWPERFTYVEVKRLSWVIVILVAVFMTTTTSILINWMAQGMLLQGVSLLFVGLVGIAFLYYVAEFKGRLRPYQLLLSGLLFIVIPPALAFFIQSTDHHRFLTFVVIGLLPAYLAYQLLIQIKRFDHDRAREIKTIVTQIGWEKAMVFHNGMILLTFLIFALIAVFGFPWFLLWPVFLVLPIGLLEIVLMERVRRGERPMWQVMQIATLCVFFIPIYLLGFAFWIR